MTNIDKTLVADLTLLQNQLKDTSPLIHCITNPISINDCANMVLAIGGRPIMAEHPGEVAEITAISQALALNLGNITDARMESMVIAGKTAKEKSVSEMSDSELQSRINRLQLEQRYNQLKPKQISSGKKFIETVFKPAASEASKQLMKEWMVKAGREAMGLNNNNNNSNNNNRRRTATA